MMFCIQCSGYHALGSSCPNDLLVTGLTVGLRQTSKACGEEHGTWKSDLCAGTTLALSGTFCSQCNKRHAFGATCPNDLLVTGPTVGLKLSCTTCGEDHGIWESHHFGGTAVALSGTFCSQCNKRHAFGATCPNDLLGTGLTVGLKQSCTICGEEHDIWGIHLCGGTTLALSGTFCFRCNKQHAFGVNCPSDSLVTGLALSLKTNCTICGEEHGTWKSHLCGASTLALSGTFCSHCRDYHPCGEVCGTLLSAGTTLQRSGLWLGDLTLPSAGPNLILGSNTLNAASATRFDSGSAVVPGALESGTWPWPDRTAYVTVALFEEYWDGVSAGSKNLSRAVDSLTCFQSDATVRFERVEARLEHVVGRLDLNDEAIAELRSFVEQLPAKERKAALELLNSVGGSATWEILKMLATAIAIGLA